MARSSRSKLIKQKKVRTPDSGKSKADMTPGEQMLIRAAWGW